MFTCACILLSIGTAAVKTPPRTPAVKTPSRTPATSSVVQGPPPLQRRKREKMAENPNLSYIYETPPRGHNTVLSGLPELSPKEQKKGKRKESTASGTKKGKKKETPASGAKKGKKKETPASGAPSFPFDYDGKTKPGKLKPKKK